MKSCPSCNRTYADETMTFCLIDGAVLSAPYVPESGNANISQDTVSAATAILNPTTRPVESKPPSLSTIISPQPLPVYAPNAQAQSPQRRRGKPWLMLGIAISLVVIVVGVILGFVWLGKQDAAIRQSDSKAANVRPTASTTGTRADVGWEPRNDKASLNGENLTYYPGTTPEQCQSDCDKDPRCTGFTFIRAGAYNPNDSAMCYQASAVTGIVSHSCCISAIKSKRP